MVSVKKLLVAASILLSEVTANPLPGSERSITSAEVQSVNAYAIDSRDLNDVSALDIEIPSKDKRALIPPKTTVKEPVTTHPDDAPVVAKPDAETPANNNPAEAAPPVRLGSTPEKPAACRRFATRSELVARAGRLSPASNKNAIDENQYVTANKVGGGSASVTNLSGCTALFFYDRSNVPSVYHIMCGQEYELSRDAAEMVNEIGKDRNGVKIVSADSTNAYYAEQGIREINPSIRITHESYNAAPTQDGSMKRVELTTRPGTQDVDHSLVQGCSRQRQGW